MKNSVAMRASQPTSLGAGTNTGKSSIFDFPLGLRKIRETTANNEGEGLLSEERPKEGVRHAAATLDSRLVCSVLCGSADRWASFSDEDWLRIASTAEDDGVAPLLYFALEQAGWLHRLPSSSRLSLERSRAGSIARTLLIYDELCRILTAFSEAGVGEVSGTRAKAHSAHSVVVLKGADLAVTLYPSIALRPMGDLDLLVPSESLTSAAQALSALGYRRDQPDLAFGHNRLVGHAMTMVGGPRDSVIVDLHWGLVSGDSDWRSPAIDWFWEQTEQWRQTRDGMRQENGTLNLPRSFCHLRPSANLLYLSAHLMLQHGGSEARLLWFYDLHLLVSRHGSRIDWDELLKQARRFRWSSALFRALERTERHFDTTLPEGYLSTLAAEREPRGTRLVQRMSRADRPSGMVVWEEMMCLSWAARVRFVWDHCFPAVEYMKWRYDPHPRWLLPLCYPYRWGVIVAAGLSGLFIRVTHARAPGSGEGTR